MRVLLLFAMAALLASCCSGSPRPVEPAVAAVPVEAVLPEVKPVADVSVEPPAAVASVEGTVTCRKDGDVRIVAIQPLKEGKCTLLYDNRLSGSGTQNALPNRAACELQQRRMTENFVRSGFRCE